MFGRLIPDSRRQTADSGNTLAALNLNWALIMLRQGILFYLMHILLPL